MNAREEVPHREQLCSVFVRRKAALFSSRPVLVRVLFCLCSACLRERIMANLAKWEYSRHMRTVNVGELKNQLSSYLQYVKNGEEVVIRDRSVPVARILSFRHGSGWDQEAQLVASGALKMPEEEIDWNQFFLTPVGDVSREIAVESAIESRGDW